MGALARMPTVAAVAAAAATAILACAALSAPMPGALAQDYAVAVSTSKQAYYYGDHLEFTLTVTGMGEDGAGNGGSLAYLYIVHENGKSSSPIPIQITGEQTVSTSPFPFEPPPKAFPDLPYPTGLYTISIEYGGALAKTSFVLRDSGRIVIPGWIKDVTVLWAADKIDDATYATSIEYLISNGIIDIPRPDGAGGTDGGEGSAGAPTIPQWVKQSASWWVEGTITDDEYGASLQYLVQTGVIVV